MGQDELYPRLETTLNILKGFTPASTPFLTRVNKRDVPTYYNVIINPMDLSTMTKKLKSLSYWSKIDFFDDIRLIHSNCYLFNQGEVLAKFHFFFY